MTAPKSRVWITWACCALAAGGCIVERLEHEGRACSAAEPCTSGFTCDPVSSRCVRNAALDLGTEAVAPADAGPDGKQAPEDAAGPPPEQPLPDQSMPDQTVAPDSQLPPDAAGVTIFSCLATSGGGIPPCTSNSDCPSGYPYCHPMTLYCSECVSDAHCVGKGKPYCAVTIAGKIALCVQCTMDSHCVLASGSTDKCDLAKGSCIRCTQDADCIASGLGVSCDAITSRCRQCNTHADCPVVSLSTTQCTVKGECRGCSSNADCSVFGGGFSCCDPGPPLACMP